MNATKAAVEEGIVIGGGCTLLKLAAKVDAVKETLSNEEQKVSKTGAVGEFWPVQLLLTEQVMNCLTHGQLGVMAQWGDPP